MGNKLTFCNALFIAFVFGKLGHIGAFTGMSWGLILIPLIMDIILDTAVRFGVQDAYIYMIKSMILIRKLKKIAKKEKDKI